MLIIWQVIERPTCACSQIQIKVQNTQFIVPVGKTHSHQENTAVLTHNAARYMGTWADL